MGRTVKANPEEQGPSDIQPDTAEVSISVAEALASLHSFWSKCLCYCSAVWGSSGWCTGLTPAALAAASWQDSSGDLIILRFYKFESLSCLHTSLCLIHFPSLSHLIKAIKALGLWEWRGGKSVKSTCCMDWLVYVNSTHARVIRKEAALIEKMPS